MTDGRPETLRVGQGRRPPARRPWPRLPRWFWVGVGAAAAAFVALAAVAVYRILDEETQPLFARRTASSAEQSHDVGRVVLSVMTPVPVDCGAIRGLAIAGDAQTEPLLRDAIGGLCKRLPELDPAVADRILTAARRGTVISFGVFERTGEDSATLAGAPPRVAVNTRYAGAFKGFLLPVLVHELWHGGEVSVSAEEELAARRAEAAACDLVPSSTVSRGCEDARAILAAGEAEALRQLRAQGYR